VIGRQVNDYDIGEAQIVRNLPEKGTQRVDAAGRCADPAYRRQLAVKAGLVRFCYGNIILSFDAKGGAACVILRHSSLP